MSEKNTQHSAIESADITHPTTLKEWWKSGGRIKKTLYGLGALFILMLALQLLTSFFFGNWSRHKDRITPYVEEATGRSLHVEDGLDFRLFPSPQFTLKNVVLANKEGAISPEFARIEAIRFSPTWGALLSGNMDIRTASLHNSTITYEGKTHHTPQQLNVNSMMQPLLSDTRMLDALTLHNTTFHHIIGTKEEYIIRQFHSPHTVLTMNGHKNPLHVSSHFTSDQTELDFTAEFNIGDMRKGKTADLMLSIGANTSHITLKGTIDSENGAMTSQGSVKATLDYSIATLGTILTNGNEQLSSMIANSLSGMPTHIEADYVMGENQLGLQNMQLTNADTRGEGVMLISFGTPHAIKTGFHFSHINLDQLTSENTELLSNIQLKHAKSTGKFGLISKQKTLNIHDLSSHLHLNASLSADQFTYRGHTLDKAKLSIRFENGGMVVDHLEAHNAPGDSTILLQSNKEDGQDRIGRLSIEGKKFSQFIRWMGVRVDPQENTLNHYSITGDVLLTPQRMQFRRLDMQVDDVTVSGRMVIDNNQAKVANAVFHINKLDTTPYLRPKAVGTQPQNPKQDDVILSIFKRFDAVRALDWYFDRLRLAIHCDNLHLRDKHFTNAKATLNLGDGVLRLDDIALTENAQSIVGNVAIDTRSLKPRLDINLGFDHLNLPDFSAFIGLDFFDRENTVPILENSTRWDTRRLFLEPLGYIENSVRIQARRFSGYGVELENLLFQADIDRKKAKILALQFDLFDGQFTSNGDMLLNPPEITLKFALPEFSFAKAVNQLFGIQGLTGRTSMSGDVYFAGLSAERWMQSLSGKLDLATSGIEMDGFDMATLQQRIPQLDAIKNIRYWTDYSLSQGMTKTKSFTTEAYLSQGRLVLNKASIPSKAYHKATLNGFIDISRWEYNVTYHVICQFIQDTRRGSGNLVGIFLQVKDSIDTPNTGWNTQNIERYWEQKFYGG